MISWQLHASKSIIKKSSDDGELLPNTTGNITISGLISISKLVAKHISPIPSMIYQLFQSVIAAWSAVSAQFQQIVTKSTDLEIEKGTVSHKRSFFHIP